MQSLVQEAATIEKAVAQAWRKAHQPQQFHIKVLEEPERNFLGMVTRSAKVAIMFDMDHTTQPASEKQEPKKTQQQPSKQRSQKRESDHKQSKTAEQKDNKKQSSRRDQEHTRQTKSEPATKHKQERTEGSTQHEQSKQKKTEEKPDTPQDKQHDATQQQQSAPQKQSKQKRPQSLWTQERVKHANDWLRNVLDKMGYTNISFTTEPQNLYLRIELSDHLLTRKDREKQLLASLASLMMATMQQQYKKAFRGHKVVLTHQ